MAETTLYHPNIPGLKVEREAPEAIKAHKDAGWLLTDPQTAAESKASDDQAAAKRSEAAKKAAETRRRNAETQKPITNPDAPKVTPVSESPS